MSDASDFLETAICNIFRATNITAPATVYVALYTAAPSDSGGGTELSGNGYARQAVTFGAPSGGAIANSSSPTFGPNTSSNWGSITHIGIFDASTSGNLLAWRVATSARTVNVGDSYNIAVGALTITVA